MNVIEQQSGNGWALYNGDCCEVIQAMPNDSIGLSIFSPPFADLYSYSDSERDMGNCRNYQEFFEHFQFLAKELFRVIQTGRLVVFHCMDIPAMKERDGYIGIKDFSGDLIRCFQAVGFIYHGRHTVWKDPLTEATRTKAIGLMHKQIQKDSAMCRSGLPDYVIAMRKPGENKNPIEHKDGLTEYYGNDCPSEHGIKFSHNVWRRYASPVWMDIRQGNTLNKIEAREEKDEKHICPLQLDVIARMLELYSNCGDNVLTPFAGIGSEVYQSIIQGRNGIGIELKSSYYKQAILNAIQAENKAKEEKLF